MEFSREEYWSGLLFPTPGDLLDLQIEPASLASSTLAGGFFFFLTTAPLRISTYQNTNYYYVYCYFFFHLLVPGVLIVFYRHSAPFWVLFFPYETWAWAHFTGTSPPLWILCLLDTPWVAKWSGCQESSAASPGCQWGIVVNTGCRGHCWLRTAALESDDRFQAWLWSLTISKALGSRVPVYASVCSPVKWGCSPGCEGARLRGRSSPPPLCARWIPSPHGKHPEVGWHIHVKSVVGKCSSQEAAGPQKSCPWGECAVVACNSSWPGSNLTLTSSSSGRNPPQAELMSADYCSRFSERLHAISYLCASADPSQVLTVRTQFLFWLKCLQDMPRPRPPNTGTSLQEPPHPCVCVFGHFLASCLYYNCAFYFSCCLESSVPNCPVLDSSDAPTVTYPWRRLNKDFMNEAWCVGGWVMSRRWLKGWYQFTDLLVSSSSGGV